MKFIALVAVYKRSCLHALNILIVVIVESGNEELNPVHAFLVLLEVSLRFNLKELKCHFANSLVTSSGTHFLVVHPSGYSKGVGVKKLNQIHIGILCVDIVSIGGLEPTRYKIHVEIRVVGDGPIKTVIGGLVEDGHFGLFRFFGDTTSDTKNHQKQ